jgi:predicted MFS family arabinose efflux permease
LLNPFGRAGLRRPGQREIALLRVVLAIATTALFTLAPNFWLLLIAHLTIETVIAGWLSLPK